MPGLDGSGLTAYGDPGFSRFLRRAFLASAGYDDADLARPIVGIGDTSSDLTPCHRDLPAVARAVARGVLEAGGLPLRFPQMSLGETLTAPTAMLYRNLLAIETEELLRSQPLDAAVLLGGCDKTLPAQVMGAVSAGLPASFVVAGPMLTGSWRGERLGACSDCRRLWAAGRAGELEESDLRESRDELCPTAGTCMVMGTASTMACLVEAMGLMEPGGASAPAPSGARLRSAVAAGRAAVALALARPSGADPAGGHAGRPAPLVTPAAVHNALVCLHALGGSTNAVIHLTAIARRAGIPLGLDEVERIGREVPVLVDCKPVGAGYMEDFHRAGGVPALLRTLVPLLDLSAPLPGGGTLADRVGAEEPPPSWQRTIRPLEDPLGPPGGLTVLRGSLAPAGALIKRAAASPELVHHIGPAFVIDDLADVERRLEDPGEELTPAHVLVLRNAGPRAAGMPEAASLPIPRRLARAGVRDMVRVSDARMSGTAYGTVVLHCSPEAAAGGPLALVRDGDSIALDADRGRIDLHVDPRELAARASRLPPRPLPPRGWARLFADHVLPAELGADFDVLTATGGQHARR